MTGHEWLADVDRFKHYGVFPQCVNIKAIFVYAGKNVTQISSPLIQNIYRSGTVNSKSFTSKVFLRI